MHWLWGYVQAFWAAGAELAPWLMVGCVAAGLLHVVVPADLIRRHLGGDRISNVVKAVLLGVPLPLCSCSVLPAGVALKKEGAGDGAAVGFLISTPQTGVDSVAVSAALLGWPFAVLKVVAAAVMGLTGGLIANWTSPGGAVRSSVPGAGMRGRARLGGWGAVREVFRYGFVEVLGGIWKWVLAGLAVSALVSVLLPAQSLAGMSWAQGLPGLLVMLAAGIPMYVCATGSLPIAAALVRAGMSPGAALVFLMAGPATNAATISAIWRTFGRRVTGVYLGTLVAGSLLFGWFFDWVVRPVQGASGDCHASAPGRLDQIALVVLLGLCAHLAWREHRKAPEAGGCCAPGPSAGGQTVRLSVRGISCSRCAGTLQRALAGVAGVRSVSVSVEEGAVSVAGEGLCVDHLRQTIRAAGFEPG